MFSFSAPKIIIGGIGDAIDTIEHIVDPSYGEVEKIEARGGAGGVAWDDEAHDGIRKATVGLGQSGVAFLKFEYLSGSEVVLGDDHGSNKSLGTYEFVIDEDDYLVYVVGYYSRVKEMPTDIITGLRFHTYNGKRSEPFGTVSNTKFVLQGGKILGFHGFSRNYLHSLGAYVCSTATLSGKWIKLEQKGEAPGLRCSHDIAAVGKKIYSFGGEFTPNQPIDKNLYVYATKTKTWSIVPATGDVPHLSCLGVGMVSIGTTLYVFGGRDGSRQYNGFYSFDTTTNEWKLLTPLEEGPTPRSFHSMAADDENVYVFGGVSSTVRLNTLDVYNIVEQKWTQLPSPGDSLSIRGGAGLEVIDGKVWVVYGFPGDSIDDVHYFDVVENKWTQVETSGCKPCARSVFASASVGKYIIIFGGEIAMDPQAHVGPGYLSDGTFALDTETLKWEKLDKIGVLLGEEERPATRGWSASTAATIKGKKGLVMFGGKAPTNDRFEDLFFYAVDA